MKGFFGSAIKINSLKDSKLAPLCMLWYTPPTKYIGKQKNINNNSTIKGRELYYPQRQFQSVVGSQNKKKGDILYPQKYFGFPPTL